MDGPRRLPFHRALYRPNLWGGGERKLALTLLLLCTMLAISNPMSPPHLVLAFGGYALGIRQLRKMAKRDPRMSEVYQRQLKYQPYHPPRRGAEATRKKPSLR